MRRKDFTRQRNNDILRAYKEVWHQTRGLPAEEIFNIVARRPSRRFWVSEERCAINISRMIKGDTLQDMSPTKQEMYRELYQRYLIQRERHPSWPLSRICVVIVNQPAPAFYITPKSLHVIFCRIKRQMTLQSIRHHR